MPPVPVFAGPCVDFRRPKSPRNRYEFKALHLLARPSAQSSHGAAGAHDSARIDERDQAADGEGEEWRASGARVLGASAAGLRSVRLSVASSSARERRPLASLGRALRICDPICAALTSLRRGRFSSTPFGVAAALIFEANSARAPTRWRSTSRSTSRKPRQPANAALDLPPVRRARLMAHGAVAHARRRYFPNIPLSVLVTPPADGVCVDPPGAPGIGRPRPLVAPPSSPGILFRTLMSG